MRCKKKRCGNDDEQAGGRLHNQTAGAERIVDNNVLRRLEHQLHVVGLDRGRKMHVDFGARGASARAEMGHVDMNKQKL